MQEFLRVKELNFNIVEYKVTKCICYDTTFDEMKQIMEENDLKTLKELQDYKMVAGNCKLCLPFIKKMIDTGETSFTLTELT